MGTGFRGVNETNFLLPKCWAELLWTLDTRTEPLVEKAVAVSKSLLDATLTLGKRRKAEVILSTPSAPKISCLVDLSNN